jgi:hypothetical protein
MKLLGEMHASPPDAVSGEINHYLSLQIPAEYEDRLLHFWKQHEQALPALSSGPGLPGHEHLIRTR